MIRKVYISPLNNIQFVKSGVIVPARYNSPIENESWLSEQLAPWEEGKYCQKIQQSDRFNFETWTNSALELGSELKLYSCDRELIDTISLNSAILPEYEGLDTRLYRSIPDYWETIPEGQYFLVLTIPFPDSNTETYISEPLNVAEKWEGTVYGEYRNSVNVTGVIFENNNVYFGLRIEGEIRNNEQLVSRVTFEDQEDDTEQLYSNSYDGYQLLLGSELSWVPDYMVRKASHVFDCDSVLWESTQYTAADGAAFEKGREDNYKLVTGVIELRLPDNQKQFTWTSGGLNIIMSATTYPYVVMSFAIKNGTFTGYAYNTPILILDVDDLNAFISDLNVNQLPGAGMTGNVSLDGANLVYTLGTGENYDNSDNVVFTKYIEIKSTTTSTGQNLNLNVTLLANLAGGQSGYALINPSNNFDSSGFISGLAPFTIVSGYVAGEADDYIHKFFHDDTMGTLRLQGTYFKGITGPVPALLKIFSIINSPAITTFNMYAALNAARLNLTNVVITGCANLTVISSYYDSTPNLSLIALRSLILTGNKLSVIALNGLYNNMGLSAVIGGQLAVTNGTINTSGQVPATQPTNTGTGNSALARSTLINTYGWTVTITP